MTPRIYIDTSVIGGCLDDEFARWSELLFDEFRSGIKTAVVSDLTLRELEGAPEDVKEILSTLPDTTLENVFLTEEAEKLALSYLENKVVSSKHLADAQHIAIASVERVDVLVSWNFQQIVNLDRIHAFNSVNLKQGYPILEIRSPMEVICTPTIMAKMPTKSRGRNPIPPNLNHKTTWYTPMPKPKRRRRLTKVPKRWSGLFK